MPENDATKSPCSGCGIVPRFRLPTTTRFIFFCYFCICIFYAFFSVFLLPFRLLFSLSLSVVVNGRSFFFLLYNKNDGGFCFRFFFLKKYIFDRVFNEAVTGLCRVDCRREIFIGSFPGVSRGICFFFRWFLVVVVGQKSKDDEEEARSIRTPFRALPRGRHCNKTLLIYNVQPSWSC